MKSITFNMERIQEIIINALNVSKSDIEIVQKDAQYYAMVNVHERIHDENIHRIEELILRETSLHVRICCVQQKSLKKVKTKKRIPHVKKVIIICSGKGGVGKSTVSSHIAYGLRKHGIGLFDADIYGPSIQHIFDVKKEIKVANDSFIPNKKHDVKLMSMGFVISSNDALVWRGPMVSKTLHNLLMNTDWRQSNLVGMKSDLNYLIIDTPPGTGDVHLSLAENYEIDGAIIVSGPQELAIANAHRSVDMLRKLDIKILGIVENMAYLENENGSKNFIFGEKNVEKYAQENDLLFLSQIPIVPNINLVQHASYFQSLCDFIVKES